MREIILFFFKCQLRQCKQRLRLRRKILRLLRLHQIGFEGGTGEAHRRIASVKRSLLSVWCFCDGVKRGQDVRTKTIALCEGAQVGRFGREANQNGRGAAEDYFSGVSESSSVSSIYNMS